jgi:hypothetical protein
MEVPLSFLTFSIFVHTFIFIGSRHVELMLKQKASARGNVLLQVNKTLVVAGFREGFKDEVWIVVHLDHCVELQVLRDVS